MIVDLLESENFALPHQNSVVIVGAGPVGIYLAHRLSLSGKSVVLVEAGGSVADSYRNEVATRSVGLDFLGYRLGRAFGLGGTSVVWGGQLAEFDAADFPTWPISYDEVSRWYGAVYKDLSISPENPDTYRSRLGRETSNVQPVERFFTHWLPQQNFARIFRKEVIDNPDIPVLLNATVNGITFADGRAQSIKIRTANQSDIEIKGSQFIFCNGTLEIVRFFLSTARTSNVPWKNNALIGKFYQDHLCGRSATAEVIDERRFRDFFENAFAHGIVKLQSKLRFRPELHQPGDLGICGFFSFKSDMQDQLGNIKWLIRALRSGAQSSSLASLPRDLLALLRMFAPITLRYLKDRRIMAFFDRSLDFMVQSEQNPMAESQIRLCEDQHPVPGLFAIEIDWQIDQQRTIEAVKTFTLAVDQYLQEHGLARLTIDDRVKSCNVEFLKEMVDVYHHAGGMCMSAQPNLGVVDPDCRVWGTPNVYVAGASVFPSSGHANTTFTALALAARLASTLQSHNDPLAAPLRNDSSQRSPG
jgi:GMC oxidoreductase